MMISPTRQVVETTTVATDRDVEGNQFLNQYRVGKVLGKGMHGKVRHGYDTISKIHVAIKVIKRNPDKKAKLLARDHSYEEKIRKEVAIMKKCRHEHVVRLYEVIDAPDSKSIFLILEYMEGGEVAWRTTNGQPTLSVEQSRRIFKDVVLGLEYLHYQGIIHRDIKPANLLWTANRQCVKISDFGVSHFSYALRTASAGSNQAELDSPQAHSDDDGLIRAAGSPAFYAPEMCLLTSIHPLIQTEEPEPLTKAIDVWALGITLFSLLFGKPPFQADTVFLLWKMIPNEPLPEPPFMGCDAIPSQGDEEGRIVMNILRKLLDKNPKTRLTLDETKRLSWVLRDITDPENWLRTTAPGQDDLVIVTEDDTRSAFKVKRRTIARVAGALFRRPFSSRPRSHTAATHPASPLPVPSPQPGPSSSSSTRPSSTRPTDPKPSSSKLKVTSPGASAATLSQGKRSHASIFIGTSGPGSLFRRSSDQGPSPPPTPSLPIPPQANQYRSTPLLSPNHSIVSPMPSPGPFSTNGDLTKQQKEVPSAGEETSGAKSSRLKGFLGRLPFRSNSHQSTSKKKGKMPALHTPLTDTEGLASRKGIIDDPNEQTVQRSASWGEEGHAATGYDSSQLLGIGTDDAHSYISSDDDIDYDIYGAGLYGKDFAGAGGFAKREDIGGAIPSVFAPGTAARSRFGGSTTPQQDYSSSQFSSQLSMSMSRSGLGIISSTNNVTPPMPQYHSGPASTPSTSASSSSAVIMAQPVPRVFSPPVDYQKAQLRLMNGSPLGKWDRKSEEFSDKADIFMQHDRDATTTPQRDCARALRGNRSLSQSPPDPRRDSESDRFADAEPEDGDSVLSIPLGGPPPSASIPIGSPRRAFSRERRQYDDDDDDDDEAPVEIKRRSKFAPGSKSPRSP